VRRSEDDDMWRTTRRVEREKSSQQSDENMAVLDVPSLLFRGTELIGIVGQTFGK
jgi:hypothetical protein